MLSTTHKFLFVHVPKTGGNSIQKALLPFSDDHMVLVSPHHDGVDRFEIRSPLLDVHKHSRLQDYRDQLEPDVFDRLLKVTCVRNPWDRCVSYFFSPHRGPVTWTADAFEAFILSDVHAHAHYLGLDGQVCDPFDNVDVVLRFEQLGDDFERLCLRLGIRPALLQHVNASKREHYRGYYPGRRLIELVGSKFAAEIARYDYRF